MDRMPWFKWWDGSASDPKLRMIAEECSLPCASVIGAWAYLLEKASTSSERGTLPEDLDYRLMAYTLQLQPFDVETVCNAMKRAGLVTSDGVVTKWEDRQAKRQNGEPPGASTKRVQEMRKRQKQQENKDLAGSNQMTGNVTGETVETACNDTKRHKRKSREEEEKETKPKPSSPADAGEPTAPPPQDAKVKPFDLFWMAYPRKVGKLAAQKAWTKIKPSAKLAAEITAAVEAQKTGHEFMRDGGEFIPHAATWLNAGRWTDEVREYVPPVEKKNNGQWWATHETMAAFGLTLDPPLTPNKGEYMRDFGSRIQAALERKGAPEPTKERTPYVPPLMDEPGEQLSMEERRERLASLKAATGVKTAKELLEEQTDE